MNKARAMLDALMGPGRDQVEKDGKSVKEKFKDATVCKSFLAGMCPFDASVLGGKRKFAVCEKIHSELMKEQLAKHPDAENLMREYEKESFRDLDFVIRECDAHIALENNRIREDVRRKKPPLPIQVNDRLAQMKRESSALIQRAEALDDDKVREKEALIQQANDVLKEREEVLEEETKKAIAALPPQVVCEVCGTAYEGDGAVHKKFRIHEAYTMVRARFSELKPRVEEWEKANKEKNGKEDEKPRKKENGKKEESKSRARDKDREKERSRRKESRSHSRRRGSGRRARSERKRRESRSRSRGRRRRR
mmetsp:Transcript_4096/g.7476  ORF Transcript_4096/g.7476 Transcript_4096/m.7476 type:complete len:309 (-) Transcript_4096:272-1198(-)